MALTINQALAAAHLDRLDARALLRHVLDADDAYLISHGAQPLTNAQSDLFSALVRRRRAGEPIAYITGMREFFSLPFKITPAVLIPRPETELLVEFALEHLAPEGAASVLDLGTGSGCIAISIARARSRAQITAIDANPAALAVARDNAQRLLGGFFETPSPLPGKGIDAGVVGSMNHCSTPALTLSYQGGGDLNLRLVCSDWFSALGGLRFDVIVANPPYVAEGDAHLTGDLRFEPPAALVAGSDGLDCIRLIVASAPQYLVPAGWLVFEHGYDQAERCRKLLAQSGFTDVFSRADLAGIERVSVGRRGV